MIIFLTPRERERAFLSSNPSSNLSAKSYFAPGVTKYRDAYYEMTDTPALGGITTSAHVQPDTDQLRILDSSSSFSYKRGVERNVNRNMIKSMALIHSEPKHDFSYVRWVENLPKQSQDFISFSTQNPVSNPLNLVFDTSWTNSVRFKLKTWVRNQSCLIDRLASKDSLRYNSSDMAFDISIFTFKLSRIIYNHVAAKAIDDYLVAHEQLVSEAEWHKLSYTLNPIDFRFRKLVHLIRFLLLFVKNTKNKRHHIYLIFIAFYFRVHFNLRFFYSVFLTLTHFGFQPLRKVVHVLEWYCCLSEIPKYIPNINAFYFRVHFHLRFFYSIFST